MEYTEHFCFIYSFRFHLPRVQAFYYVFFYLSKPAPPPMLATFSLLFFFYLNLLYLLLHTLHTICAKKNFFSFTALVCRSIKCKYVLWLFQTRTDQPSFLSKALVGFVVVSSLSKEKQTRLYYGEWRVKSFCSAICNEKIINVSAI